MTTKATLAILKILENLYPNPKTALKHNGPFQLLVATILSAQCTDERVNQITETLFPAFPTAHHLAAASFEEVAAHIVNLCYNGLSHLDPRPALEADVLEKYSGHSHPEGESAGRDMRPGPGSP